MEEMKIMDKNKERLSALFDGQLNDIESSEVLALLESDKELQNELADYALIHSAMNDEDSKIISMESIKKTRNPNIWLTSGLTAAASVLMTVLILNEGSFSRMSVNSDAQDKLAVAINSTEAQEIIENSGNSLVDHVLNVINNPDFMNSTSQNIDLRNVGFALQNDQRRIYRRGNENFTLRVEKKNLGLNKVRYWKHNNKMIYLVPLNDGTVVTIYGNIDTKSAIEIARNIKK
jgi:hypothetical protein|tara:strand:- start:4345 stop:5043 length:699 start_codon:yes stop_codon:yes gene_type:complete